jgi:GR25 family glycosyltransferase involved in LPS biosynthesis
MKYTIIQINDRVSENVKKNKIKLSIFDYVGEIKFCDASKVDSKKIIEGMGFSINWNPFDGRTLPPLSGELGIWVSNIEVFKYIVKNNISKMLVIEDDAILKENFVEELSLIMQEVPKNFDFVSLYSNPNQNKEDETTSLSLKYLHKSINQYAGNVAMIYSFNGAKKILRLLKKEGIEYTVDCQIFRKSLEKKLDGYSLKKEYNIAFHDFHVASTIDPQNLRQN